MDTPYDEYSSIYSFWLAERKQALRFSAFDKREYISDWSHSNPDALLNETKENNKHKSS